MSILNVFFPGLSMASAFVQQLLAVNLDSCTRPLYTLAMFPKASILHISYYDEAYDMRLDCMSAQPFVHNANSLIARVRYPKRTRIPHQGKKTAVSFSPWDGFFPLWFRGLLLILHCAIKDDQENIYIYSIG
ncbi:hypothetical protein N7462_006924 [Penicillium macrosclerotiorum]|uniref:uncharacterized protein n=1 Tax=Penicillium macrosclerotiorum TaxID=303699 RepID=UPI0025499395|nr:uncharacterized protein N7462_006924 [Penicillium macrosclerotiorum]KAJ5678680.1 hypothetical protein N7462_006924 [Penicillium macrosclerotiorum]